MGRHPEFSVEEVEAALIKAGGNYTHAAQILSKLLAQRRPPTKDGQAPQCSPNTVKNYIKRHRSLQRVEVDLREIVFDLAESVVLKAIRQALTAGGDLKVGLAAARFHLTQKGQHRGYGERQEIQATADLGGEGLRTLADLMKRAAEGE